MTSSLSLPLFCIHQNFRSVYLDCGIMNDICFLCEFSAMRIYCFYEKRREDNISRVPMMKSSSSLGNNTLPDSAIAKGQGPLRDWKFSDAENEAESLLAPREQF